MPHLGNLHFMDLYVVKLTTHMKDNIKFGQLQVQYFQGCHFARHENLLCPNLAKSLTF
jgi:hypothetical protein